MISKNVVEKDLESVTNYPDQSVCLFKFEFVCLNLYYLSLLRGATPKKIPRIMDSFINS